MAGLHAGRWVVGFLFASACVAAGQQQNVASLPNAPSAQFVLVPAMDAMMNAHIDPHQGDANGRASLVARYEEGPEPQNSEDFFQRHLNPSVMRQNMSYHPSMSGSLMGRATYAASRIFFTRNEDGKGRVNTSYFLTMLTSAVVHTAYRPYWNRPVGAPFSDFGSAIGNDAGMNVLHEFGPGLEQLVKNHTPRFVERIEERVGR